MAGRIFITSSGYDPECGKHVKDPYLDDGDPLLGACRPDVREAVKPGNFIFAISGKIQSSPSSPPIKQYIMGGFEVSEKIEAVEAYSRFPNSRLKLIDGELYGNVIVDENGRKHPLDQHSEKNFDRRCRNFIVGKNLIKPESEREITRARKETMKILKRVLGRLGIQPFDLIGRSAKILDDNQVAIIIEWLLSLKDEETEVKSVHERH